MKTKGGVLSDDSGDPATRSSTRTHPRPTPVPPQDRDTQHEPRDPHGEPTLHDGPPDPVDRVIAGIGALSRALDRYRHAFGADHDLNGTEVVALVHLFQEHTATAGQLAARTGLTPGAVTALLDRLERRGYLTRTRPRTNRRTLHIELTPAGWALRDAAFDPVESLLRTAADQPEPLDLERMAYGLIQTTHLLETSR